MKYFQQFAAKFTAIPAPKLSILFKPAKLTSLCVTVLSVLIPISAEQLVLDVDYIKEKQPVIATLSNLVKPASDSGFMGSTLGVNDSNTTGKFLNQKIVLNKVDISTPQTIISTLEQQFSQGSRFFVVELSRASLKLAREWASDKPVILFNINLQDDFFRQQQCSSNTLHTIASYAMKNDALAQWLLKRRFNDVLVVTGQREEDKQLTGSFKRAAKRYGIKLIKEKTWDFDSDLRRSAGAEMPLFTQTRKDYDVVFVADKHKDFAQYLPFNTYLPRPVIGSAGLEALGWHRNIEQWGATQLQNRFIKLANRAMNEVDFSGYLAIRTLASALTKTNSADPAKLLGHIKSDQFELAAYLGRKLSYRPWSQQLRMPIALVQPNALISQSPQAGMLHPVTELDTLGFDHKESTCQ
ncbi:ABC transporter substrate-binding protein [Psychrobium sp. 1_MG-2023]|uniref:ABC transporter substrate-binding protein n=1 Tax=Psychrobium sp. 1_MG-2023 TaxID=3062624 RepID=UPI000C33DEF0|nr:ABC transporter substrate-binding protein [Psychrobium sp. 1_MG-2023]MDP2561563.1 ABC transporter substrate-binding protein [Psychrobium sp. 1_MG-2023]PKF55025.1 branched-chain amino acid ABC transporter substrate-binding protein [Alteromonadales bacterium alter-6D02]